MSVAAQDVSDSSHPDSVPGLSRRVLGARIGRTSNAETADAATRLLSARRAVRLAAVEAIAAAADQLVAGIAVVDVLIDLHHRSAVALDRAGYPTACSRPGGQP